MSVEFLKSKTKPPTVVGLCNKWFFIKNVCSFRYFKMSYGSHCALKLRHDDIIYSSLPLYHSAAGILGVGMCFFAGCTLALRSKFSASKFWDDCIETKATVSTF